MDKKLVNVGGGLPQKEYEDIEKFSQKVFENMTLDNIPPTPEYYKIYFQKTLLEEKDCEFRKKISQLNLRDDSNENEKILEYETKLDTLSNISKHMLKNINSTYKKTNYLVKFIDNSSKQSSSIINKNTIEMFFNKLKKTISTVEKSLKKDLEIIKELYSKNISVLREIEANKIYDSHFQVFKKEYFLAKLKKEVENSYTFNYKSYLMAIRLNKKTIEKLKTPINVNKANKFFSKVLQNKFRKNDIIGYLDNGVFGVILSNLNQEEVKKVAFKFKDILNNSSMFIDDDYIELKAVIAIKEIDEECYIKITQKTLDLIDKVYSKDIPYIIE